MIYFTIFLYQFSILFVITIADDFHVNSNSLIKSLRNGFTEVEWSIHYDFFI